MLSENSALIVLESYCLFPSSFEHTSTVALFAVSFIFLLCFCVIDLPDWVIETVVSWLILFSVVLMPDPPHPLTSKFLEGCLVQLLWTSFLLCTSTLLLIFMTQATADFQILNLSLACSLNSHGLYTQLFAWYLSLVWWTICLNMCRLNSWFHSPTFFFSPVFPLSITTTLCV